MVSDGGGGGSKSAQSRGKESRDAQACKVSHCNEYVYLPIPPVILGLSFFKMAKRVAAALITLLSDATNVEKMQTVKNRKL
ncbi:hypothetical protein Lal_00039591 [Lupinus albus]|nr:hypothetical protein Lal_00039591 [Lupinus albus]